MDSDAVQVLKNSVCNNNLSKRYIFFQIFSYHVQYEPKKNQQFIHFSTLQSVFYKYGSLSVFIQICPRRCEKNSTHIVRRFPSSFRFVLDIVAKYVEGKNKNLQYVGIRVSSQILTIFIIHSIQFFILSSKLSKFLKLNQK